MIPMSTKALKGVYQTLLATFLALLLLQFTLAFGPIVERTYFPVMINGEILEIEEHPNGISKLTFSAEKVRDCNWSLTSWWLGHLTGASAQVTAEHQSKPQVRPTGLYIWENLWVGLSARLIRTSSYSLTYHDCHPFWRSQSVFFNSEWQHPLSH